MNNVLQKSNAAAQRIFETLDVPVERPRELGTRVGRQRFGVRGADGQAVAADEAAADRASRSLRGLSSRTRRRRRRRCDDVNLTVPQGQSVAVVGRNGSGKTTLLALLPRFYDPQQGGS